MQVEALAEKWLAAKRREQEANAERLEIEKELLKHIAVEEEGSKTTQLANGARVKATGKMSYKADIPQLTALTAGWPEEARPLKTKIEADESLLKAIRHDRPDLWARIAPAITLKPAKTYIVVEHADGL